MRPFYIYKAKHGVFYVQFSNELTHERCTAISTRERSYTKAMKIACEWMQDGIPSKSGNRTLESKTVVDTFHNLLNGGKLDAIGIDSVIKALAERGYTAPEVKEPENTSTVLALSPAPEAVPASPPKTPLVSFLEDFWNYETSQYVQDKLIHKQRIGKRHCYDSRNRVSYWKDFFCTDKMLEDISTLDLKEFERSLAAKGLGGI
jgi:hypothetical protein